ncbi:relaxase/mobilization nuclease domain-containing protein [Hyphomonas sp. UBA1923]|uniref:relaxase/mobilization nuclease domain-containing protein n=1 Tax=Hyphomonas sp. UBA1923 TaxID=1946617 RepID=UPI0025B8935C|nr:relaxase/mobilization nuclease domain-containing protein [Hyphomonas sp. UBA1923]|tara:strand:- start:15238 stop:16920 length:1683 start_codon:yes stop_codon:yes gene_type:complete
MRFKIPARQPSNFRASARYLAGRTKGVTPERVEWVFAQNLQTTDPDAAAAIMDATAARSTRCRAPAYHFILTFDPKDAKAKKISPDIMREIAEETISRMGLKEHQALVYAHRDTDHPHMHFLINRVHPVEGRAYSRHEDGKRLTELCRDIARERGLNIPNDRTRVRENERNTGLDDIPPMPTDGDYWQAKHGEREPEAAYPKAKANEMRKELHGLFGGATSWELLSDSLMERGYYLREKGQGMVISDGLGYVKLSDMGRGVRAKGLEKRFGESFKTFEERVAGKLKRQIDRVQPPLDLPPDMSEQERRRAEKLHRLKEHAAFERKDRVAALDEADFEFRYWHMLEQGLRRKERDAAYWKRRHGTLDVTAARRGKRARDQKVAFSKELAKTYRDPEKAMSLWNKLEQAYGARAATNMVRKEPSIIGRLQGVDVLGRKSGKREKAEATLKDLTKRRRQWKCARDGLADTQTKREQALHNLTIARRDLDMMYLAVGSPERFRKIVLEKIKRRALALNRVTAKMIEQSNLTDERKQQLTKAWRQHRERQRERGQTREMDRDFFP